MEVWELVAREQLRDVIARYHWAGDRGRIDDMLSLFTADAVLSVDGVEHPGHGAIRSVFEGAIGPTPGLVRHFTTNVVFDEVAPSHAASRAYFQVLTDAGLDHWGRYRDTFFCNGDQWQFTRRDVRVDGRAAGGWAEAQALQHRHDAP